MPEGLRAILNEIAREVRLILLIRITYKNCKIGIFYKIAKICPSYRSKITKNLGIDIFLFWHFCLIISDPTGNTV